VSQFIILFFYIYLEHRGTRSPGLSKRASTNRRYWPVLQKYCSVHWSTAVPVPPVLLCSTTCITSPPWTNKMPIRSPCPKAAEARGRRQGAGRRRAWGSRGHFGGRCCLTAVATTDHSPDASRLRHPGTGTGQVQVQVPGTRLRGIVNNLGLKLP
jgi:hypothetical protein